jgi:hypothetical protein
MYVYNGWKVGIVYPNHSLNLSLMLIVFMHASGGKSEQNERAKGLVTEV